MDQVDWLEHFVLYLSVFLCGVGFVLAPVLIFIHEFGHALAIRMLTGKRPVVVVGESGRLLLRLNFSAFDFHLYSGIAGGACVWDPAGATVRQYRWIIFAGPLTAAVGALGFALLFAVLPSVPSLVRAWMVAGFAMSVFGAFHDMLVRRPTELGDLSDGSVLRALGKYPGDRIVGANPSSSRESAAASGSRPPPNST